MSEISVVSQNSEKKILNNHHIDNKVNNSTKNESKDIKNKNDLSYTVSLNEDHKNTNKNDETKTKSHDVLKPEKNQVDDNMKDMIQKKIEKIDSMKNDNIEKIFFYRNT
ncbi:hypothetical protein [Buchnera aphidicola]|uniref:hypothetical protein n=1 Tax=Buchnera aphidicola TaxID=9 RepID=UPI003BEEFA8E